MARQLEDWIAETRESIVARLDGAREAQRQTRFTLGMMALISMMMLILSYNAYLSYDLGWLAARTTKGIAPLDSAFTVEDILTHQALQDWAASRNATIDLLGIRVSVDDIPVLGTISLVVVSLWLLLVTRRENHTVGSLLRDTDTPLGGEESVIEAGSLRLSEEQRSYSSGQRWLISHDCRQQRLRDIRSLLVSHRFASRSESTSGQGCHGHERHVEQARAVICA